MRTFANLCKLTASSPTASVRAFSLNSWHATALARTLLSVGIRFSITSSSSSDTRFLQLSLFFLLFPGTPGLLFPGKNSILGSQYLKDFVALQRLPCPSALSFYQSFQTMMIPCILSKQHPGCNRNTVGLSQTKKSENKSQWVINRRTKGGAGSRCR